MAGTYRIFDSARKGCKVASRISRRQALGALAGAAAAPLIANAPVIAQQAWPRGRTIKVVVPFPAGGATDVLARIVADRLSAVWGASMVIENRAGAGGNIGMEQVARAEPNGETILMGTAGLAINRYLFKAMKFDGSADFAPLSLVSIMPNLAVAPANAPYNSIAELIAYIKANPGKLTCGTSGRGTSVHLSGELFKMMAGVQFEHLHYRGSAPALQDLIAGRTGVMFDNMASCLPQVQAKTLKALAVTTSKRSKFLPAVPTVSEALPGFDVSPWFGLLAPAKTPPQTIELMSKAIRDILKEPAVIARLDALAAESSGSTPQEFTTLIREETEKWGKVTAAAGITPT
ncbi:MAG: tripartite tricarboxylate transporter substrate binding protein [Alphaproteobacteria bacterium]|nr:tripartite tricarboxylate transporter substrate binding protein [Alphaproteobacteria bacterium]